MKLRCVTNSIRIRVKKSDLATLTHKGLVRDYVKFGPQTALTFGLMMDSTADRIEAIFMDGNLTIVLPQAEAKGWIETEQVGIEAYLPIYQEDGHLHILIEKDFPCQHREDEDKSDTFVELSQRI